MCGNKHQSLSVIQQPASVVHSASMSEVEVDSSMDHCTINKSLANETVKPSEICKRLVKKHHIQTPINEISEMAEKVSRMNYTHNAIKHSTEEMPDRINTLIQNDHRIVVWDIAYTLSINIGSADSNIICLLYTSRCV